MERIAIPLSRLGTLVVDDAPAFVVVLMGVDATDALVYSQGAFSFALPIPMVALVFFTRNQEIMGEFANGRIADRIRIPGIAA